MADAARLLKRLIEPFEAGDFRTPEQLRDDERRRRLVWGLPLLAILIISVCFGTPGVVHAIKGWQSRRLAREALALIERVQWREAFSKARDAYQLRSSEPESWRAIATLLTRTGQAKPALEWWRKVSETHRLTPDDRRAYGGVAISVGALPEAKTQIDWLLAQPGEGVTPADTLLASRLASQQGNSLPAADYALVALKDGRSAPPQQISAIVQLFAVAEPSSWAYAAAWTELVRIARDPANPASLDALRLLASSSLIAPTYRDLLLLARDAANQPTPDEIAHLLKTNPKASLADYLLSRELRVRAEPAQVDVVVAEVVQRLRNGDFETIAELTRFLNNQRRYATTLQLLSPKQAAKTSALTMVYLDALAGLGRWEDIKSALSVDHLQLSPVSRNLYLAAASVKLQEPEAAASRWDQALIAVGADATKLVEVGIYAENWGALAVADEACAAAIKADPTLRPAYDTRQRLAHVRGDAAAERALLTALVHQWPDDLRAKTQEAYLGLLLDDSASQARTGAQAVLPQAIEQPADWLARGALALARLHQGNRAAAMAAFSGDRGTMDPHAHPGEDVPAGAQAVWAATLEANGWKTEAEAAALEAAKKSLLPQERDLIASLLTK